MHRDLLEEFRALFLRLLNEYQTTTDLPITNDYADELDRAQEDRDNLLILKLKGRNDFFIKKVKEALHRMENNSFGICTECGGEIEITRLRARPVATLCTSCKEEEERGEAHLLYHRRSHTLGRSLLVESNSFSQSI